MSPGIHKTAYAALFVFMLGLVSTGRADDTDIYLNPNVPTGAEPLVMFTLDIRSNVLNSTFCSGTSNGCDGLIAAGYLPAQADNSYNFSEVLSAVMRKVVDPLKGFKIGLMVNHNHETNAEGHPETSQKSNGAYVLQGFKSMSQGTDPDGTMLTGEMGEDPDKLTLYSKLDAISAESDAATSLVHPFQGKELYFELFRYLTGQGIYNGHNGFDDYGDNNDTKNLNHAADAHNKLSWDDTIETGSEPPPTDSRVYVSPLAGAADCTKIFVVNIMFQVSQQENDSDTAITQTTANGGMGGINLAGTNNKFDTVIRYMKDADLADGAYGTAPNLDGKQNVVSFFLVRDQAALGTAVPGYATAGGTGAPLTLGDNVDDLAAKFNSIFKTILSVSTTFVAPSVPVNVFNRAQVLNEVYMALFEADENGYPFWPGNLKKLVIASNLTTGTLELQDANGAGAIDIDGRLKRDAVTFWTQPGALPPLVPGDDDATNTTDGRAVTRGGTGQNIPGFVSGTPGLLNSAMGARQLFYEDLTDVVDGLKPLNADATTATELWPKITQDWVPGPLQADNVTPATSYTNARASDQERALKALRFARGLAGLVDGDTTTKRSWMMADPLHSRPRPINYGARGLYTNTNPDIRILMGTNDGFMHLFTNTTSVGAQDGKEAWAIIPQEVLPWLDRLRTSAAGTPVHPISVDGTNAVLQIDNNLDGTIGAGDKVYAYFGLRRGGKSYYAFDITDPDAPKLLWKISKGDPGFAELAQTWSTPAIGKINTGSGDQNVLVFGGGYNGDDGGNYSGDLGKDAAHGHGGAPLPGSNDDEGNAVYVVDALTGQLVWKAAHPEMLDSIPSEVAAIDTDGTGLLDRIYVGDTGGRVWRIDMTGSAASPTVEIGTDPSQWQVTRFFEAGRHYDPLFDRRFFNRPDVVLSRDSQGAFDAVLIGSGDREDPLGIGVVNQFYMVKDRNTASGIPPVTTKTPVDLADLTTDCVSSGSCSGTTQGNLNDNGWFFDLPNTGEKNLAPALTLGGAVFFTTFTPTPPASACGLSEGTGRLYAVSLQDATALFNYDTTNDAGGETNERSDTLESGGIPVEVIPIGDDKIIVQGQEAGVGAGGNIQPTGGKTAWDTYWYRSGD